MMEAGYERNMTKGTVLITGACGDIGRAIAARFAQIGFNLALCDLLDDPEAKPQLERIGADAAIIHYRRVDVANAGEITAFTNEAAARFGSLDICIGNAGIVERGKLIDLDVEAWNRQLNVNLNGCFLTAQACARIMRRNAGGHIIFISSWTQDVPWENIGAYCVSKSGIKMLAQCLALELAPHGIRVNLVAPGFVDAGLTGQNLRANPQRRPVIESAVPLGRLMTAGEVAGAVMLMCSPDASYVTGATLLVDGGRSLNFGK
jgi:NAD(P)-dependent dehydrogenase (short-subunit alcohol dehydrogenase family)